MRLNSVFYAKLKSTVYVPLQDPDDCKIVSFDAKSLFTTIALQLAFQCAQTAIQQSPSH